MSAEIEQAVLDHALAHPCHGPMRVAQELVLRGPRCPPAASAGSGGGANGLPTKHDRLLRLEKTAAERALALTDEQIRLLERFSPEFRQRHIEAPHTGALVAVDTFFVGVLKGRRQGLPADRHRLPLPLRLRQGLVGTLPSQAARAIENRS